MSEEAPLLNDEADHPHDIVLEHLKGRVVAMDSARYVDSRNEGRDVVVPSSYLGVLPARLIAPHRPRAVIAHDGCIGKDGAGIAGLWYLEALGIPAAAADGMTAELGNGIDLYETGMISRVNILAERAGVSEGMSVKEAALVLLENDGGCDRRYQDSPRVRRYLRNGKRNNRYGLNRFCTARRLQQCTSYCRSHRAIRSEIPSRSLASWFYMF